MICPRVWLASLVLGNLCRPLLKIKRKAWQRDTGLSRSGLLNQLVGLTPSPVVSRPPERKGVCEGCYYTDDIIPGCVLSPRFYYHNKFRDGVNTCEMPGPAWHYFMSFIQQLQISLTRPHFTNEQTETQLSQPQTGKWKREADSSLAPPCLLHPVELGLWDLFPPESGPTFRLER